MSPIFLEMLYIIKVLYKLSKLLLALYNILLTNASGQVEFYTPATNIKGYLLCQCNLPINTGKYRHLLANMTGLPLGGRTPYITSKNRLRTPKLHIKDVPRTSENSLVRPKIDIETSCLQKKPAHIYQIT